MKKISYVLAVLAISIAAVPSIASAHGMKHGMGMHRGHHMMHRGMMHKPMMHRGMHRMHHGMMKKEM
jgi:hypothetical protein